MEKEFALLPSRREVLIGLLGAGGALIARDSAYGQTLLEGEAIQRLHTQESLKQEIASRLREKVETALTEAGTHYLESMSDVLRRYMEQAQWPALTVQDFPFPKEPADDPFYVNFAHPLLLRGASKTAVHAAYSRHWEAIKSWHVSRILTAIEKTSKELTEEAIPDYLRSGNLGKIPQLISEIHHNQAELIEVQSAVLRFPNEESHEKKKEASTQYRFEIQMEQFQLELEVDYSLTLERYNRGETTPGETFDGIAAMEHAVEVARKQLSEIDISMIYDHLESGKREKFYFDRIGEGYRSVHHPYDDSARRYRPQESIMMAIIDNQSYQLEIPQSLEGEQRRTVRRIFRVLDSGLSSKKPHPKIESWEELQAKKAFFKTYYGELAEASERVSHNVGRADYDAETDTIGGHGNFNARAELHEEHRTIRFGSREDETYTFFNTGLHMENIDAFLLAVAGLETARQR